MVFSNEAPYFFWHGLPWPAERMPSAPHCRIVLMKTPLSLPPIVIVTSWVLNLRASSCGATPGCWAVKKSLVWAAPQVTSARLAPVFCAMTLG
jgi:hypothetical protein